MQPVVHLAVGYLCYAGYTRWHGDGTPDEAPALAAIVGAALPDLIDKPIWLADLVAVGRTIGHSLLFAIPVVIAVWLLTRARDRPVLGIAFAIGYLSHIATDVPWHVISGDVDELGFLFWPLTPMPAYTGTKPLGTVPGLEVTVTTLWLEAVILVAGVALWWADGRPGTDVIRRALSR
ncbi:metal-dependent hydrolase [Natronolimnohabitans sp. A-GB9]|uniref:metal-dependent hydrolase n=1 Tax=Natronolimnohabitans sp. A-GB9 TaxID=3069757 RepID=UPI0027B416FF|nr:metal-dependent hydrolase [Natronolimnohabitans sp. A-GB9]MDQ2050143.1 metal-dependent hydrolase [Natronolimnohabitans sp. A-GB9]